MRQEKGRHLLEIQGVSVRIVISFADLDGGVDSMKQGFINTDLPSLANVKIPKDVIP